MFYHTIKNFIIIFAYAYKFIFIYAYDYIYVKNKPIPPELRLYFSYNLIVVQLCWLLVCIYKNLHRVVMKYNTYENMSILKEIVMKSIEMVC